MQGRRVVHVASWRRACKGACGRLAPSMRLGQPARRTWPPSAAWAGCVGPAGLPAGCGPASAAWPPSVLCPARQHSRAGHGRAGRHKMMALQRAHSACFLHDCCRCQSHMQVAQWPSQQQPAAAAHLYGHPQQGHDALVAALRQQAHLLPHQGRVDGGGQLKHLREQRQAGRAGIDHEPVGELRYSGAGGHLQHAALKSPGSLPLPRHPIRTAQHAANCLPSP